MEVMYPWHEDFWQVLQPARSQGRLPHALLFSGAEGCGHESLLQFLIKSLLCLSPAPEMTLPGFKGALLDAACGQCRSCQVFEANAHPDYHCVTVPADKKIIGVDQIRQLNHFLELSCSYSPVRVALINAADTMNQNAANSLLKSLEEPVGRTHIILFSTQPSALLPTIRSRCQHFRLPLPETDKALTWLGVQNPVQEPKVLLQLTGGRPLSALQQDSGELIALREIWQQQLTDVISGQRAIADIAGEWAKQPRGDLLDWQLSKVHLALRSGLSGEADLSAAGTGDDRHAETVRVPNDLWGLYDQLLELKRLATHPLNNQLFAENMLSLWLK